MHLVAGERHAVGQARAGDRGEALLGRHHRLDVEEAEARHRARRPLDPVRVGEAPAQHLVAAAQAQHPAAPADMGAQIDVPALLAKGLQVVDRGLGARQQHQGGLRGDRRAGPDQHHRHARLRPQGVEVVEIGDARQHRHRHRDGTGPARARAREPQHVLRRQARGVGEMRHEAEGRPAGPLGDHPHAVGEQARIAAEAVDEEAGDQGGILRVDHGLRADEARDHPAPVDVADQHHRRVGGPGEAHIGDVARPQVHLGGRARALDEDQIGLRGEAREAVEDGRHQPGLPGLVVARLHGGDHPPLHHHLGADLALRLQQHRVHVDRGRHPGGPGLQRLRAADLAAVRGDGGVVRHVLRLERAHPQAPVGEGARQPRHDQRLADVGAGALDHQGLFGRRAQNSIPSCAFTPAAKWCLTLPISVTRSAASIRAGLALRPVTTTCRSGRRSRRAASTASRSR